MRGWVISAALLALGGTLAGCAATTPTNKTAVNYNRIFARSRDEVLVTNILRASAREPLQFSTMGNVTGSVRNNGTLSVPLNNLISRVQTIVSPTISVNEGINPTINIIPLSNKEFTEGILKAVTPEEVNYFINQGWDQEMILELVVGAVVCPSGEVVFNKGTPKTDDHYDAFARMFAAAKRFPIRNSGEEKSFTIRMNAGQALTVMKEGVGNGRKVEKIEPVSDNGRPGDSVDVTIVSTPVPHLEGLDTSRICGSGVTGQHNQLGAEGETLIGIAPINGADQGKVILRSVEAIIYFLGETQRYRWQIAGCGRSGAPGEWPYYLRVRPTSGRDVTERLTLLRIDKACGAIAPFNSFTSTHFDDQEYYVARQADAGDTDRSLSTLSFLNELIALQTSESTIAASAPVVTVGAH
jgi:hypothetical protein